MAWSCCNTAGSSRSSTRPHWDKADIRGGCRATRHIELQEAQNMAASLLLMTSPACLHTGSGTTGCWEKSETNTEMAETIANETA